MEAGVFQFVRDTRCDNDRPTDRALEQNQHIVHTRETGHFCPVGRPFGKCESSSLRNVKHLQLWALRRRPHEKNLHRLDVLLLLLLLAFCFIHCVLTTTSSFASSHTSIPIPMVMMMGRKSVSEKPKKESRREKRLLLTSYRLKTEKELTNCQDIKVGVKIFCVVGF